MAPARQDPSEVPPAGPTPREPQPELMVPAKPFSAPPLSPARPMDAISPIAGTLLPIERAEELLQTLPGVLNVRIVSGSTGEVSEVHILTTTEVSPKQTVRNVESALLAHLGMRVSHKKISVATSEGPAAEAFRAARMATPAMGMPALGMPVTGTQPVRSTPSAGVPAVMPDEGPATLQSARRRLYFEDVEVRRSRTSGMMCRVTLRIGEEIFVGEAEGVESDRLRTETAARAAVNAVAKAGIEGRSLAFEGARLIGAFDREFVFVALTTRVGRETTLLTGTAQVKDGIETATVLAVLDATNRWMEY